MSSAYYGPRRRKIGPGVRSFANRAAMLANAVATRTVGTQRSAPGRPRKSLGGKTVTSSAASTQTSVSANGSGTRTITSSRVKKTRAQVKVTPARFTVKTAAQMVRANTRVIKQAFQLMAEVSDGYGAVGLRNTITNNICPLHAYCLTTIDRPNTDLGNTYPLHIRS
jgi:hypothetical protein